MTSEERLRREIIKEMEETWRDEDADEQEKTLLTKILSHLQSFPSRLKDYYAGLIETLREKNSPHRKRKVDSQTAIEKSSSENLRSKVTDDIKEALNNREENREEN